MRREGRSSAFLVPSANQQIFDYAYYTSYHNCFSPASLRPPSAGRRDAVVRPHQDLPEAGGHGALGDGGCGKVWVGAEVVGRYKWTEHRNVIGGGSAMDRVATVESDSETKLCVSPPYMMRPHGAHVVTLCPMCRRNSAPYPTPDTSPGVTMCTHVAPMCRARPSLRRMCLMPPRARHMRRSPPVA